MNPKQALAILNDISLNFVITGLTGNGHQNFRTAIAVLTQIVDQSDDLKSQVVDLTAKLAAATTKKSPV